MTKNNRGRPPLSKTENTVAITVTVTESQFRFLRYYGDFNVSLGVRCLVSDEIERTPPWILDTLFAEQVQDNITAKIKETGS